WVRSVGRWQLELDPPLLASSRAAEQPGSTVDSPGIRHVIDAFSSASCRVCPLVMLIDHRGYGQTIRSLAQRFLAGAQSGPAAAALPAPALPRVDAASPSASRSTPTPRTRVARSAARIVRRVLSPCARHRLLSNLVDAHDEGLRGLSGIPQAADAQRM